MKIFRQRATKILMWTCWNISSEEVEIQDVKTGEYFEKVNWRKMLDQMEDALAISSLLPLKRKSKIEAFCCVKEKMRNDFARRLLSPRSPPLAAPLLKHLSSNNISSYFHFILPSTLICICYGCGSHVRIAWKTSSRFKLPLLYFNYDNSLPLRYISRSSSPEAFIHPI